MQIISHLKLKNWKNFPSVEVNLQERTFIVGPNASGKSNFLDALKFLRDIAKEGGGLQKAVNERGGVSKIRCLAARKNPDIELGVTIDDTVNKNSWRYEIGIKQEARGYRQPYLAYEKIWHNSQLILDRPDENDKEDFLLRTQTHLEQITANAQFREIAKFLESISYMHVVPQLIRFRHAFSGPGIPGDPFGREFLESVAKTSKRIRDARLKKIEQALQLAVPQLKQLSYAPDTSGYPHLEAIYEHWRPSGAKQQEDQFSDGTLRLLGLLWLLLDGDSLLLLEEPELSLNTGIVNRLASLIYRMQMIKKGRQVILSTHSADLLSDGGIGAEEVLLLLPSSEGTTITEAYSIYEIQELLNSGLSLADIVLPYTMPKNIGQLELFR